MGERVRHRRDPDGAVAVVRRVVVTGSSGRFGSALLEALVDAGHMVVGIDRSAVQAATRYEAVQAELADEAALSQILHGDDLLVHAASIHPWREYPDSSYLALNASATWHLYAAAAAAGIRDVILTSTIGAAGNPPPRGFHRIAEDERHPCKDIYTWSKRVQEEIAESFALSGETRTLALRPAGFIPVEPLELGFLLTRSFTILEEVVAAHLAAVSAVLDGRAFDTPGGCVERVFVTNELPYGPDDVALVSGDDYLPVVAKYWPDAIDWLVDRGFTADVPVSVYDGARAKRVLDWRPVYTFRQWFDEHRDTL